VARRRNSSRFCGRYSLRSRRATTKSLRSAPSCKVSGVWCVVCGVWCMVITTALVVIREIFSSIAQGHDTISQVCFFSLRSASVFFSQVCFKISQVCASYCLCTFFCVGLHLVRRSVIERRPHVLAQMGLKVTSHKCDAVPRRARI